MANLGGAIPVVSFNAEVHQLYMRFKPNGSSAIDNSLNEGPRGVGPRFVGFTVTRTAAGTYLVTLGQAWQRILVVEASVTGGIDAFIQRSLNADAIVGGVNQIELKSVVAGSVADIPAAANNYVEMVVYAIQRRVGA